MKTLRLNLTLITAVLLMPVLACTQTGCMTGAAAEYASDAFYVAGSDFAVWKLSENPGAGPALDHLAALLPKIPLGQVTPYDLGMLSGELNALQSAKNATAATAAETSAFDRIISLIGNAATIMNKGGNPTAITGAISAQAQSFSNGMVYGKQFNAGRTSVKTPPEIVLAKASLQRKTATHP